MSDQYIPPAYQNAQFPNADQFHDQTVSKPEWYELMGRVPRASGGATVLDKAMKIVRKKP